MLWRALIIMCLFSLPGAAQELKISTWNFDWLTLRNRQSADLPKDVRLRPVADFTKLAAYVHRLNADIIAFQEVDGVQAAAAVFDPTRYRLLTISQDVVQQVGLAVRHDIAVTEHEDVRALASNPGDPHALRNGLDATLHLPGGADLRVLVVHLKSGCQTGSLQQTGREECGKLARQIAPLAQWVAAREHEGAAFLLLGDFNRVFDTPEQLGIALAQAAPLLRATQGRANPCWEGAPFIDHIFVGGPARLWFIPGSLRVQIFRETGPGWKQRLSDHCPVSIRLNPQRGLQQPPRNPT